MVGVEVLNGQINESSIHATFFPYMLELTSLSTDPIEHLQTTWLHGIPSLDPA